MEIGFLGGAQTVTGSKFLVHHDDTRVLVDCGMFQGLKALRLLNWEPFPFDAKAIDAVLLTHAHLDHCGALPLLVKQGFKGPIYATAPTIELTKIILLDSAKIQEEEAEYANRKKYSKHSPALALYTTEDVEKIFSMFRPVELHQDYSHKALRFQYFISGHILGAASVLVSSSEKSIYFSGDLGRKNDPLMWPPEPPPQADVIVMESTYGNRQHSAIPSKEILKNCISEVVKSRGVLLIPSFSVGRAQNLLQEIIDLKNEDLIPSSVPVYFNSPMGMEASKLYAEYPDFHRLRGGAFEELLAQVHEVRNADESKQLNLSQHRPLVIVAASGMLTGGRVLHHFRAFAGDAKNIILLAGFQAAGTRGRDLQDGKKEIKVHGLLHEVRCKIVSSDSFSAHADQRELITWLAQSPNKNAKVYLVHGESEGQVVLTEKIRKDLNMDVEIAEMNRIVRLH